MIVIALRLNGRLHLSHTGENSARWSRRTGLRCKSLLRGLPCERGALGCHAGHNGFV